MQRLLVALGIITVLSIACAQTAPVPATPAGGGAFPTATRPAGAGTTPTSGGGQPSAEQGRQLVTSKGCIACHVIPNVPGATSTIGPSLEGVADASKRPSIAGGVLPNNPDNIKRWLTNPPAIKPGTLMPNLSLNPTELDSLVAFLQTLK